MGKGSTLAFIALVIGIGGVGIGGYAIIFMPTTIIQQASGNSEITQIWTVEQVGNFYTGSSYSDMTDMDVNITVNAGETVYVMFNAQISNGVGGSGWLTGGVRIMMDTALIAKSERYFILDSTTGISVGNSITTHFIIEGLTAGTYELKVQATALAENGSDRIEDGLLIVYTYR
ncbi:MAG: hypothetical protein Lokiarch_10780 [Candidatus Lokiarchaeum sp. GC14_75]|nr:MAG: hypothetical protein Lokiarch_10780 [Candidatus Lokiarchaeum sp. GC14_75]HEC40234.1 hypothetical protein [bacterium]